MIDYFRAATFDCIAAIEHRFVVDVDSDSLVERLIMMTREWHFVVINLRDLMITPPTLQSAVLLDQCAFEVLFRDACVMQPMDMFIIILSVTGIWLSCFIG